MKFKSVKYQFGGLASVLPQMMINKYPEAVRVGSTRPEEFAAIAAGEEGRYKALDYIKSDRYKNILRNELNKSKASDYPSGKKPTFDELYNERLNRIQNTPIQHMEKNPWVWSYKDVSNKGGVALTYPGTNNKIIGKTYVNPSAIHKLNNTYYRTSENDAQKRFTETGMEEALHNTHQPLTTDSNTLREIYNPRHVEQQSAKSTNTFNITPYAENIIKSNTVDVNKMINFPADFTEKDKLEKSNYTKVPTEIITQIPKVLSDTNTKGRFTNKSFKHMLSNPTVGGERLLNATSGSFNPYVDLKKDKKLYRQALKNTKKIMNNIADVNDDYIPIARNGMRIPRIIKPSNISNPPGRKRSSYYSGNIMQDGGNLIENLNLIDPTGNLSTYIQKPKIKLGRGKRSEVTPNLESRILTPEEEYDIQAEEEFWKERERINESNAKYLEEKDKLNKKLRLGGNINNVAQTKSEMQHGLNAGINQFNFPTKGLKKMTMTPKSGNITDPVIMEGYTDGSLTDRKTAQPGQSSIDINADTIVEKPDLSRIDDFNEAYDHADRKKYPIFVWKNQEYYLKQHKRNK